MTLCQDHSPTVGHLAVNQHTHMQASPRYWDSRHKIPHTLSICIYTYFTLIPADSGKEKQAPKHNFHPSPTSSTSSLYSRDLQWEKKKKGNFSECSKPPLCPQTLYEQAALYCPLEGLIITAWKEKALHKNGSDLKRMFIEVYGFTFWWAKRHPPSILLEILYHT